MRKRKLLELPDKRDQIDMDSSDMDTDIPGGKCPQDDILEGARASISSKSN